MKNQRNLTISKNNKVIALIVLLAIFAVIFSNKQALFESIQQKSISTPSKPTSYSWKQYKEDELGFSYKVPSTFHVTPSSKFLENHFLYKRGVKVTNMDPTKNNILYMPEGGIGGVKNANEMPIYNGISITIYLLTTDGKWTRSEHTEKIGNINGAEVYQYGQTFSKNGFTSKGVYLTFVKNKKVYKIDSIFLDNQYYNQIYESIISSISIQ